MNPNSQASQTAHVISSKVLVSVTVLDVLFFGLSSPVSSSSVILVVGSVFLAAGIYAWSAAGTRLLAAFYPLRMSTQRRLVLFMTTLLTVMILMQSIGQLSWRDVIALVVLAAAFYAYLAYAATMQTQPKGS